MTRKDVVTEHGRSTALTEPHAASTPTSGVVAVYVSAASAWAPLLALAVFLWVAGQADLPRTEAWRALTAIAVTQVVPGTLVWRALRPRTGWWFEDVAMGFVLGLTLAVVTQAFAGVTGALWLSAATGPAVAVVLMAVPGSRARVVSAQTTPLPWGWGPTVAVASLALLRDAVAFHRLVPLEHPGFMSPYVDMPFHLSLVGQLAERGPTSFPYVANEPLAYHWFSHAWVAQISQAGGVEIDSVLYRVIPGVVSVALVAIIAVAAMRISGRPWTGPAAAILATAGGTVSVVRHSRPVGLVQHLSPSLGLSSVLVVALLLVLACRWRGDQRRPGAVLVVVLGLVAAGTKGSALPVVVAGVVLATAVAWLARSEVRRLVTLDAALLTGSLFGALVVLFGGSTQGLAIDPAESLQRVAAVNFLVPGAESATLPAIIVALLLLLAGVLAFGAGLLAACMLDPVRRDPIVPVLLGVGLAGAAAVGLVSHQGGSQGYFLRNAIPALAIGSAVGLAALWHSLPASRRRVVVAASAVAVIWWLSVQWLAASVRDVLPPFTRAGVGAGTLLVLLVGAGGLAAVRTQVDARRVVVAGTAGFALCLIAVSPGILNVATPSLPDAAQIVPPDRRQAFSGDQIEAARWLRDHSDRSDVVATNRHCANPRAESCDSRRFFVAAYTERQVLVEGWAYTPRAIARGTAHDDTSHAYVAFWDTDLLELNDGFLLDPSAEEARRLWQRGVRWLFIDRVVAHADGFGELADLRYETEYARVYELATPAISGDHT